MTTRIIFIESDHGLEFKDSSTILLKADDVHVERWKTTISMVKILTFPAKIKSAHGGDLESFGLDITCKISPELLDNGGAVLGAYVRGNEIVVSFIGDFQIKPKQVLATVSFYEKVRLKTTDGIVDYFKDVAQKEHTAESINVKPKKKSILRGKK